MAALTLSIGDCRLMIDGLSIVDCRLGISLMLRISSTIGNLQSVKSSVCSHQSEM